MRIRFLTALAVICLLQAAPRTTAAGVSPYLRGSYGGGRFEMNSIDGVIAQDEVALTSAGLPVHFDRVGSGYGPEASAGLWLLPGFRVGATYAYHRSIVRNSAWAPGFYYDDLNTFRVTEIGLEAAVRFVRLGGLTFGVNAAQARAEADERFTLLNVHGADYVHLTGRRGKPTYGTYIGIDQTAGNGSAGFIHLGYAFRDMGRLPGKGTESDGFSTVDLTGHWPWLNYSGLYLQVGMGFDLVR